MSGGHVASFLDAVERDPGAVLPHAAVALVGVGAPGVDSSAHIRAVHAYAADGDERERSLAAVVAARIGPGGTAAAERLAVTHLASWPRDVLALATLVPAMGWSGRPGAAAELAELVEGLSQRIGHDWWLDALLAFVRQEQGRHDEAAALAERSFATEPRSGHAAHARSHVHYETGDHRAGHAWLSGWSRGLDPASPYAGHLSWHLALHELAGGDVAAARERWARDLAPRDWAPRDWAPREWAPRHADGRGSTSHAPDPRELIDGGSLAWRLRMRGCPEPELSAASLASAARPLANVPVAFLALHVSLAAAAAGDTGLLEQVLAAQARTPPHVRDLLEPVVRALTALLDGRPGDAADELATIQDETGRFGGSHAQRDVLEETYLAALLAAGRAEEAGRLIERGLDRRPSPLLAGLGAGGLQPAW